MKLACDANPDIPQANYGRLGWFTTQLSTKFNKAVTIETVRKWFSGEALPRHKTLSYLAHILNVDEAWLTIGKLPELSEKQMKVRDASADGAVNVVAGLISMGGGHPAFPEPDDRRAAKERLINGFGFAEMAV